VPKPEPMRARGGMWFEGGIHLGIEDGARPSAKMHPALVVDDLEALIASLGLPAGRRLTLVLHDWGGMIGMAYAHRHPERIKRLVLMNTSAFRLPKTKPFPLPLWLARDTALGAVLVRGFNAFSLAASYVCCTHNPMNDELRRAYQAPYDSWDNRIATLRFVQDIPLAPGDKSYDIVSQVEEGLYRFNQTPKLILWGEKDFVFDRHFLDGWVERFPDAEVHRFPEGGHYVLEDEKAHVIPLIKAFLAAHPLDGQA
jgi:haloalkane dehalogenase